jgi:zinc protease
VTGDAPTLSTALARGAPTPISYDTPKAEEITTEDREIVAFPLGIAADRVTIVPVDQAFER